jgi:hypothetical protein
VTSRAEHWLQDQALCASKSSFMCIKIKYGLQDQGMSIKINVWASRSRYKHQDQVSSRSWYGHPDQVMGITINSGLQDQGMAIKIKLWASRSSMGFKFKVRASRAWQ